MSTASIGSDFRLPPSTATSSSTLDSRPSTVMRNSFLSGVMPLSLSDFPEIARTMGQQTQKKQEAVRTVAQKMLRDEPNISLPLIRNSHVKSNDHKASEPKDRSKSHEIQIDLNQENRRLKIENESLKKRVAELQGLCEEFESGLNEEREANVSLKEQARKMQAEYELQLEKLFLENEKLNKQLAAKEAERAITIEHFAIISPLPPQPTSPPVIFDLRESQLKRSQSAQPDLQPEVPDLSEGDIESIKKNFQKTSDAPRS